MAFPVNTPYYAAKWGVGGFTEGIALEVAPFGVKVTALEPGGMRTNFGKRAIAEPLQIWPDYEPSVGATLKMLEGLWGNETGDPSRVAKIVLQIAEANTLPPHIVLGSDALHMVRQAEQARAEATARWESVSNSIDMTAEGPIPPLPSS